MRKFGMMITALALVAAVWSVLVDPVFDMSVGTTTEDVHRIMQTWTMEEFDEFFFLERVRGGAVTTFVIGVILMIWGWWRGT
jgi:hypothetical protein